MAAEKPLTVKQEKFAQKFVECGNQSEAYRYAYNAEKMQPESIYVSASRLLADPKVKLRVNELKSKIQAKHEVTLEFISKELLKVVQKADNKDDLKNHRGAAVDLGKLYGYFVERQHVSGEVQLNKKRGDIASRFASRFKKDKNEK